MAQTNNLWSNLLLAATKRPRMMAGLLGIANPQSYLTEKEQQQAEDVRNWGIQAVADVTSPFAKGANILAQGYGDLYRGLSGNTDYVSPLEDYIKSGISDEEMGRINTNPYKEILKSGAGMAATLAPVSTGGIFTNAATRGTRAFSGLNPSTNPLVNQLSQIVARGGFEGLLGGYGQSREGKEFQDALIGAGIGIGGEAIGEYLGNKEFRDLLNDNISRAYKMSQTPGTPMRYSDLLNGDVTVSANNYSGLLDQAKDEVSPDLDVLRDEAFKSAQIPESVEEELLKSYANAPQNSYLTDVELLQRGDVKKTPQIKNYLLELRQKGLVDPGRIDFLLKSDYGVTPGDFEKFVQYMGDGDVMTDRNLPPELLGDDLEAGSQLQDTVANRTKLTRDYMSTKGVPEPDSDALKDILDTYRERGFLPDKPGDMLDGTVRQPDVNLVEEAKKYKSAEEFIKAQGETLYHGTSADFKPEDFGGGYLTADKTYADKYQDPTASAISYGERGLLNKRSGSPRTLEYVLDKDAKIFDFQNPEHRKLLEDYFGSWSMSGEPVVGKTGQLDWTEGENLVEFFEEKGFDFDGIKLDEGGGFDPESRLELKRAPSIRIINPEKLKSIEALKGLWRRVTGK